MTDPEIRTHVTFKTPRFNMTEVRPYFINDCCFGDDCAGWLVDALRERGWPELADPWQEDWGWQSGGRRGEHKFLVNIGLIPEDEPEWLVFVQEKAGFLARLRGAAGSSVVPDLTRAIDDVLRTTPNVSRVRWHFQDVFMRGRSDGHNDPFAPRTAGEASRSPEARERRRPS